MAYSMPESPAFPPNYKPSVRIAELPPSAPIEQILSVIDRDGCVILNDLVDARDLESIEEELGEYTKKIKDDHEGSFFKGLQPQQTVLIGGVVGKSATLAKICEHPVLEDLRREIITDDGIGRIEGSGLPFHIDPLLSVSLSFRMGSGAPRQLMHRDDGIFFTEHGAKTYDLKKEAQFGCMIAAVETTQANGATVLIPGSHRWDDKREPRLDECTFAEMKPGAALIFLGSCWHGGGHNSVPNFTRVVHGLFFCRGKLRTQENQFLAVPRSKALAMSPKMQSLLGYKQPGVPLGTVENSDPMLDLASVLKRANL